MHFASVYLSRFSHFFLVMHLSIYQITNDIEGMKNLKPMANKGIL
jgi:hypothetical protein